MYKVSAVYIPPTIVDAKFDYEYFFSIHVPMMNRDFPGKVPMVKVDVETGIETLVRTSQNDGQARSAKPSSPESVALLAVNIYFASRDEAYDFANFVTGPDAAPLHEDVPKYTNCDIHWTVAEISEPA